MIQQIGYAGHINASVDILLNEKKETVNALNLCLTARALQCTFYFFMFVLQKITNKDMSRISHGEGF